MSPKISIIIPALNEGFSICRTLEALQTLRQSGHEVIVVDGGSNDATAIVSQPLADCVVRSPRGRSQQMNAGAEVATGTILFFLHADSLPPRSADRFIIEGMAGRERTWGHFDVTLTGRHPLFRIIEFLMNWRSRLTGIATGDQGIFVHRDLFKTVGGFPHIELMEDISLSRILKRHGPPLCLSQRLLTSSRRWEKNGILRTVMTMWGLRLAYALGMDAHQLARIYGTLRSR